MFRKYFEYLDEVLYIPLRTSNPVVLKHYNYAPTFKKNLLDVLYIIKAHFSHNLPQVSEGNSRQLNYVHWFYCLSINNLNSLAPVYEKLGEAKALIRKGNSFTHNNYSVAGIDAKIGAGSLLKAVFLSLCFVLSKANRRGFWGQSLKVLISFFECRRLIATYKPKSIFFANDHVIEPRVMLIAAREKNIPTVYFQHACVTKSFPPIGFTWSFFDGNDALHKYKRLPGAETNAAVIGMPKLEEVRHLRNFSKQLNNVGICVNECDNFDVVYDVITGLLREIPGIRLTLRLHPGYNFSKTKLVNIQGVQYSDKTETSFSFLSQQDMIIAGNSSIHLEAILMNTISVQFTPFDVTWALGDYYGFIEKGMVLEANSIGDVIAIINKYKHDRPQNWYLKGQYYVENVEPGENPIEKAIRILKENKVLSN